MFGYHSQKSETLCLFIWIAESARGSDLMLEAVLEAEVAQKAKQFFAQAEKETPALKGDA